MSETPVRRLPFWLTLSVLLNMVLIGLIAGIFVGGPKGGQRGHERGSPGIEVSREDRETVRALMRESFEAGRTATDARREAERALVDVLSAEPYDEAAARAALAELREADSLARKVVAERMIEGLDELSPEQRALVARVMAGNIRERGKRGERLERWRERREEHRERGGEPETDPAQ